MQALLVFCACPVDTGQAQNISGSMLFVIIIFDIIVQSLIKL